MGALASKNQARPFDDFVAFDLGPQSVAQIPEHAVYSLESLQMPGHFVRDRASDLWIDKKDEVLNELYAFDSSFVLVPGLLGFASSLRSANFPLQFVRERDSKLCVSEYDGSEGLRSSATFEFRLVEDLDGSTKNLDVCITSATNPGKYFCVDKNNRLVFEGYQHFNREAYHFRLVPGLAAGWDADLGSPLCYDVAVESTLDGVEDVEPQEPSASVDECHDGGNTIQVNTNHFGAFSVRAPPELSAAYMHRRLQLPALTRNSTQVSRPTYSVSKTVDFEAVD